MNCRPRILVVLPSNQEPGVYLTSITLDASNQLVGFPTPSAVALALSIAVGAGSRAEAIRSALSFVSVPGPDGPVKFVERSAVTQLFDFFEQCFVSATFSFQALEVFCNFKIAYEMNSDVELQRRDGPKRFSKDEVQREASTEEKLATVLPQVLGVQTPKGKKEWEQFVRVKRVRHSTIHLKSHHQWTSNDEFSNSPYGFFIKNRVTTLPRFAVDMIQYFGGSMERTWLEEANRLLNA